MKKFISIVVSLVILTIIYWKIDFPKLVEVFQNCDRLWMVISLLMVFPLTMLAAWRLQQLMPSGNRLGFGEANRLILAASVLNMVLPSKMGDIAKAYFMKEKGHLHGLLSLSLVVFEKACDMLSLLLWCAFGLILYPQKDWLFWVMTTVVVFGLIIGILLLTSLKFTHLFFKLSQKILSAKFRPKINKLRLSWEEMHKYFWQDNYSLFKIAGISIFIWFGHLLQIWFFILALKAWAPFLAHLALSPLAILAGLLPLTFAGVGTRDAALIAFYQPYFHAPTAAALGLLCTCRYLLPAIGGLPFLGQYLTAIKNIRGKQKELNNNS
ncbi:lysylphosphatidylglycerol synthase transmembrane domain-containing protein [Calothrix rhizosoleniae]|uniref:lysylphosphatidylglycerol synthase transmembrane domain-containing protein n=1 Tax=Calothrix rhizosoleniae TaxID=888997 RepID=UPI000B49ADE1|nr:lysylphosphatidylglycerol synthase transmembrane domain-containing protein [Calothrix rhizosoleniae]